jgi:hypothetical protein
MPHTPLKIITPAQRLPMLSVVSDGVRASTLTTEKGFGRASSGIPVGAPE